jgi:hypothetical protein
VNPADSSHGGPGIELTHLAAEMLVERGIKREWIDLTIRRPAAT